MNRRINHSLVGVFLRTTLIIALLSPTISALAERAALIIGNNAYPGAPLTNAVGDATDIRDLLMDRLEFPESQVVFATDLDRISIFEQLEKFKVVATDAEIVLVYFAGHGMESLDGKENFLIPVDADVGRIAKSEAALRAAGVNMISVMNEIASISRGAKVILMDCCRQRPAGRGLARAGGGLVQYSDDKIPADTLMILAAAPNRLASDGQENGPFTRALIETLPLGGQDMLDAFFAVSDRVQELTSSQQVPWLKFDGSGRIFREFRFVDSDMPAEESMEDQMVASLQKKINELEAALAQSNSNSEMATKLNSELKSLKKAIKPEVESLIAMHPAIPNYPKPASQPANRTGVSGDPLAGPARSILAKYKASLVVVTAISTLRVPGSESRELQRRTLGATVAQNGLIAVSNSAIDGSVQEAPEDEDLDAESDALSNSGTTTFGEIEISYGDSKNLKATVVKQYPEIDLAFIQPTQSNGSGRFDFIPEGKGNRPRFAQDIVGLSRSSSIYAYMPTVVVSNISVTHESPEGTVFASDASTGEGIPIFSTDSTFLGLTVRAMLDGRKTKEFISLSSEIVHRLAEQLP